MARGVLVDVQMATFWRALFAPLDNNLYFDRQAGRLVPDADAKGLRLVGAEKAYVAEIKVFSHEGEDIQNVSFKGQPCIDGMSVAGNRVFVSTVDGRALCYESKSLCPRPPDAGPMRSFRPGPILLPQPGFPCFVSATPARRPNEAIVER